MYKPRCMLNAHAVKQVRNEKDVYWKLLLNTNYELVPISNFVLGLFCPKAML